MLLNDFSDSCPACITLVVRLSMEGDPAAWVRCDGWHAGSFTEIELAPEGKARLIKMEISNHLSTLRSIS